MHIEIAGVGGVPRDVAGTNKFFLKDPFLAFIDKKK